MNNNYKQDILVSVITVCYNSENTIIDTLESIINQTYKNIEYIIIDGNSTDSTVEIIRSYEDKFLEKGISYKWNSEKDNGLYDAMNKGIDKCTGELVGFINSDDWYDINAIQNTINEYDNSLGVIHGNLFLCDLDKNVIKPLRPLSKQKLFLRGTPFLHPACFFKLSEVKKLRDYYNLIFKIAADYDFMIRLIKMGVKTKYINKNIGYFREGGISTTEVKNSLYESHKVRVHNGVNSLISYIIFLYLMLRSYAGRILRKLKS